MAEALEPPGLLADPEARPGGGEARVASSRLLSGVANAGAQPLPGALLAALAARDADVRSSWAEGKRVYLFADSPQGRLFGRASSDPRDLPVLAHEAAVREIVGTDGVLRAPAVVERGDSWLLETAVAPEPPRGAQAVDTVVAAAARIVDLRLPSSPAQREGKGAALARRFRTAVSALPVSDYLAARRVLAECALPLVTSHGDFSPDNALLADGSVWAVDWELSGTRPAGYDLMQFSTEVHRPADHDRLFEAAVDWLGAGARPELLRLRYALVVLAIATKLAARGDFDRDAAGAQALLAALPDLRIAAGIR